MTMELLVYEKLALAPVISRESPVFCGEVMNNSRVSLIGAPTDIGAGVLGARMGPDAVFETQAQMLERYRQTL